MPITEKATIRSKCTFSKDRKHKFLLTLEWEEKKPKAVVIMTSPAEANCIVTDLITSLVIKNLHALGYGGCDLVNLGFHFENSINGTLRNLLRKKNCVILAPSAERSIGEFTMQMVNQM